MIASTAAVNFDNSNDLASVACPYTWQDAAESQSIGELEIFIAVADSLKAFASRLPQGTRKVRFATSDDMRDRASPDPVIRDIRQSARYRNISEHNSASVPTQSELLGVTVHPTRRVGVSELQGKFPGRYALVAVDFWIKLLGRTGPEFPEFPGECYFRHMVMKRSPRLL